MEWSCNAKSVCPWHEVDGYCRPRVCILVRIDVLCGWDALAGFGDYASSMPRILLLHPSL